MILPPKLQNCGFPHSWDFVGIPNGKPWLMSSPHIQWPVTCASRRLAGTSASCCQMMKSWNNPSCGYLITESPAADNTSHETQVWNRKPARVAFSHLRSIIQGIVVTNVCLYDDFLPSYERTMKANVGLLFTYVHRTTIWYPAVVPRP